MKLISIRHLFCTGLFLGAGCIAHAQFIWTNAGGSFALSDPTNWLGGLAPSSGANLVIASNDPLGLDTGGPFTVHGLTINPSYTATIAPFGSETLLIGAGGVTNTGNGADFQLGFTALNSQLWSVGTGTFTLEQSFEIQSGLLTVSLGAGGKFDFANTSGLTPTWAGTLAFTGDISSTSIAASALSLSAQNIGKITIDGNPASLVNGYLVAAGPNNPGAVPEPSTYGLFAIGALISLVSYRRLARSRGQLKVNVTRQT
jgi:hypothetical protein